MSGIGVHRLGKCTVIVTRDDGRWHLSIAHPWRFPSWTEIGAAQERYIPPSVFMCMPRPPKEYWLNLHPNCFHLWEIRDELLLEIWKADGEEAQRIGYGQASGPEMVSQTQPTHGGD